MTSRAAFKMLRERVERDELTLTLYDSYPRIA